MSASIQRMRALGKHALRIHAVSARWQYSQTLHAEIVSHSSLQTWRLARGVRVWLFTWPDRRYYPAPWFGSAVALMSIVASVTHTSDRSRLEWLNRQIALLNQTITSILVVGVEPGISEVLTRYQPAIIALSAELAPLSVPLMADTAATGSGKLTLDNAEGYMRPAG